MDRFQKLQLVCFAFMMAAVVYIGVAWTLVDSGIPDSVLAVSTSSLWPRLLGAGLVAIVGLGAPALGRAVAGVREGDDLDQLMKQKIVVFACYESLAVAGLAIAYVTQTFAWAVALGVVAVAGMAFQWPRAV